MIHPKTLDRFRVRPGRKLRLKDHDPSWTPGGEVRRLTEDMVKESSKLILEKNLKELAEAQVKLYAQDQYSLLIILQAMDAAGKDGTIKHVMKGINPQGCTVYSFKRPSAEELDHSFLWRCMKASPQRGKIVIFNRSHYEEVLVVRVHPEILANQKLPGKLVTKEIWKERYDDINAYERHLARNGTRILKFFLNISKDEQKKRFFERLDDPNKNWKFSVADLHERSFWNDYMNAYENALAHTSTEWAPWYVIPSNHKYVARALVAEIITQAIADLDLRFPKPTREEKLALSEGRKRLETE